MFEWLSQVWGFDSGNNDSDSNASNDSDNNDSDNNDSDNNEEISVSNSFQEIVDNAVDLLRKYSPQDYQELYQSKISPSPSTAYYYCRNEIGIQDSDLNGDLHYLASLIVHENRHAKWYKEASPGTWQNSQQEELDCIDCQANALQRIGGAWWRINYLRAQDGNHYLKERDW